MEVLSAVYKESEEYMGLRRILANYMYLLTEREGRTGKIFGSRSRCTDVARSARLDQEPNIYIFFPFGLTLLS